MIRKYFEAKRLRPYKTCALVLDVRGREIRCARKCEPEEGVQYEMGETAMLRSDAFESGANKHGLIQIDNSNVPKAVRPGDDITFANGSLQAVVLETE